jgi:hypothetical protein
MDNFDKIKLFLLADMIEDILFENNFKFKERYLYNQIYKNVKELTKLLGVEDLTEFDTYKLQAHELINKLMNKSIKK